MAYEKVIIHNDEVAIISNDGVNYKEQVDIQNKLYKISYRLFLGMVALSIVIPISMVTAFLNSREGMGIFLFLCSAATIGFTTDFFANLKKRFAAQQDAVNELNVAVANTQDEFLKAEKKLAEHRSQLMQIALAKEFSFADQKSANSKS